MFKKLLPLLFLFAGFQANAAIINLDAVNETLSSQTLMLGAGTYDVTVVGLGYGGDYDAWNAWGKESGCDDAGKNCSKGWINNYKITALSLGTSLFTDGIRYETPLLALEFAIDTSFTLSATEYVEFYIDDSNYTDNIGGISLDISLVPEPSVIALFGLGLIGVGFARRRQS
jgi:hypothetical protein